MTSYKYIFVQPISHYFIFVFVKLKMFNVAQTNNALLKSNLSRMELLYNTSQKKLAELESKYTSNTAMLNQYMKAFTSNTISESPESDFSYTLPEAAKWQKQSLYASSINVYDIETTSETNNGAQTTETFELVISLSSPMKYIISSTTSGTASTKQLQELIFSYPDGLSFEPSESISDLILCKKFDESNFDIFNVPTLYVTKQGETTTIDKQNGITVHTTVYSIGTPDSLPLIIFNGNTTDYASVCQCNFSEQSIYVPKLKSVSSIII